MGDGWRLAKGRKMGTSVLMSTIKIKLKKERKESKMKLSSRDTWEGLLLGSSVNGWAAWADPMTSPSFSLVGETTMQGAGTFLLFYIPFVRLCGF